MGKRFVHTALLGLLLASIGLPASAQTPTDSADPAALYQQHCAACHGAQRTGAMGPALLPESLERLRGAEASKVIGQGRAATQMPALRARSRQTRSPRWPSGSIHP